MTRTARVYTVPKPMTAMVAMATRRQRRTAAWLVVAVAVAEPLPERGPGQPRRLVTRAISIPVEWALNLRGRRDDAEPSTVALRVSVPVAGELVVVRSRAAPGVWDGRTRAAERAVLALVLRCDSRTGQSGFCPKLTH
jgi:hypothetical protein